MLLPSVYNNSLAWMEDRARHKKVREPRAHFTMFMGLLDCRRGKEPQSYAERWVIRKHAVNRGNRAAEFNSNPQRLLGTNKLCSLDVVRCRALNIKILQS